MSTETPTPTPRYTARTPGMPMKMSRLRFLDADAGAGGTPGAPAAPATPAPATLAAPAQDTTDWKAEARKHEARAKEYKVGHDKAAALEAASLTDAEKAAARTAELEAKVKGFESEKQVAAWKTEVADATGVPAAALSGSTLEALQAHAAILKPLITKADPPADDGKPHVPYRDLSKVLADAPNPSPGIGTLRAAYAAQK